MRDCGVLPGLKVYATVVELPGGRLSVLAESADNVEERLHRILNVANISAGVLASEFCRIDAAVLPEEFRRIGRAAQALCEALDAFQSAARAELLTGKVPT